MIGLTAVDFPKKSVQFFLPIFGNETVALKDVFLSRFSPLGFEKNRWFLLSFKFHSLFYSKTKV